MLQTITGFGFEGHHELLVHSKAWADTEWSQVTPWVPPTSVTLTPGRSHTVGLRFLLVAGPEKVSDCEQAVICH
jgi:hypothetical protein